MFQAVFFTPSEADTRRFDDFVKKMRGDVQQSAIGGTMFHAGEGLRYCLGVEKVGANDSNNELVATMILHVRRLPFGLSWLYCPRGPVWKKPQKEVWDIFFTTLRDIARKEWAIFLRVESDEKKVFPQYTPDPTHPWAGISDFKLKFGGSIFRYHPAVEYVFSPMWYFVFLSTKRVRNYFFRTASGEISPFWKSCGFRRAHGHYQPEYTNVIDLSLSEAEILAQMKPKGRYNIRLAKKRGVRVFSWQWNREREISDPSFLKAKAAVDIFYGLFSETTSRDGFSGHAKEYYANFLKVGGEYGMGKLYVAYLPIDLSVKDANIAIAAIIVTSFGDRATYFSGASSNVHRDLMAPYLLQWTALLDAKKEGRKWYDLFGIAAGK